MESRPQPLEKCHRVIQHPLSEKTLLMYLSCLLVQNSLNRATKTTKIYFFDQI